MVMRINISNIRFDFFDGGASSSNLHLIVSYIEPPYTKETMEMEMNPSATP